MIKNHFSELPLSTLIRMCLINNKDAWNEFFHRFITEMHKAIKKTLRSKGLYSQTKDIDIVESIFERVIVKLLKENGLSTLKNPDSCEAWLIDLCTSKTIDWIREQNRKKNLARKQAEESMRSLDEPLNKEGSITLKDKIEDTSLKGPWGYNELHEFSHALKGLLVKDNWVIRVKSMFYYRLNASEINDLSKYLKRPVKEVSAEIKIIMEGLSKKKEKKERVLASAGRLHAEIINLQYRYLAKKKNNELSREDQNKFDADIGKKEKALEELRKKLDNFIGPSNEQVALVMGIPKEKSKGISLIIHRARKKLKEARKKAK